LLNKYRIYHWHAVCWLQDVLNTTETSVRLTRLKPFTNYTISISCTVAEATHGYWSKESNISAQTAQYGCNINLSYHIIGRVLSSFKFVKCADKSCVYL